jgi:hypothetical protein
LSERDPEPSFMDVDEDSSNDESFRGRRRSRGTSGLEKVSGDGKSGPKRYREASEPVTPDKYSEERVHMEPERYDVEIEWGARANRIIGP